MVRVFVLIIMTSTAMCISVRIFSTKKPEHTWELAPSLPEAKSENTIDGKTKVTFEETAKPKLGRIAKLKHEIFQRRSLAHTCKDAVYFCFDNCAMG
jgi:hypothetical protein